jgi:hypothetical protein
MSTARGVRGVIAGLFVMTAAAAGVAIMPTSAGAGADGIPCLIGERQVRCAELEVTKVVTGTPQPAPPPGTTFAVVVDCAEVDDMVARVDDIAAQQLLPQGQTPPFTTTLTFPAEGGTESVFITRSADCTVSETPPPGCTLTSIDPETTEVREPIVYPVTVTNNCDPPVQPAAAPAPVVVDEPRFTG